jgi:hypothetical protein
MFETPAGRRPVQDFFDGLPASIRALALGDVALVAEHGRQAPVARERMKQVR